MNIIDIWQPVDAGMDGEHPFYNEYYDNYDEAKKRCNGMGYSPEPKKHLGLAIPTPNGKTKVFLFASSEPIEIFHTTEEMKKERALAKLTPEERKLLGHG